MADNISKRHRSWIMSRVPSGNTTPERIVRSVLHRMGYRFRIHVKELPGKPDIVLKKHNLVVFVHGCFWHNHQGCKISHIPKSNTGFWLDKFEKNMCRDKEKQRRLVELGWRVEKIWECQTKDWSKLFSRLCEIFPLMFDLKKSIERQEDREIQELIETMK